MADYRKERSLEGTPTWAVAVVCFVLVVISIFIEHLIHLVGHVSLSATSPLSLPWLLELCKKNLN
uniref:Uncharacterized protein n=1 Tax=Kalanchoe fedtschenkoi TaxID=63787 RepID=A0A7N0V711_KALFE